MWRIHAYPTFDVICMMYLMFHWWSDISDRDRGSFVMTFRYDPRDHSISSPVSPTTWISIDEWWIIVLNVKLHICACYIVPPRVEMWSCHSELLAEDVISDFTIVSSNQSFLLKSVSTWYGLVLHNHPKHDFFALNNLKVWTWDKFVNLWMFPLIREFIHIKHRNYTLCRRPRLDKFTYPRQQTRGN